MAEEELNAAGSGAGAGENTQTQGAGQTPQGDGQSQSQEGISVGNASTDASSKPQSGRSNIDWALQRHIEKAVRKTLQASLQEQLAPILEALKTPSVPQVDSGQAQDQPDYNDLSGWINRKVNALLEERLRAELPKTAKQLESGIQEKARLQEARNYLISQQDIGRDQAKLQEIRQIMDDYLMDVASDPVRAAEKAVEIWRQTKKNPNAPPKSHLTTISGGAGTGGKKEFSIAELKALQNRLAAGSLTMEEQEKLGKEIDALVFSQ